ncbi:unnamed protein product, partial [Urochloa humidicola]
GPQTPSRQFLPPAAPHRRSPRLRRRPSSFWHARPHAVPPVSPYLRPPPSPPACCSYRSIAWTTVLPPLFPTTRNAVACHRWPTSARARRHPPDPAGCSPCPPTHPPLEHRHLPGDQVNPRRPTEAMPRLDGDLLQVVARRTRSCELVRHGVRDSFPDGRGGRRELLLQAAVESRLVPLTNLQS